ncbi:MAG: hypothetical protein FD130_2083 [Halothiobacillaceae bacterium]|nr:MAG: hypothetical protein FD130_2083 [Halothiobacillaceae bacterium]
MSTNPPSNENEQNRQRRDKILRRSTQLSLVGLTLFALLGYLLVNFTPSPYDEIIDNVVLRSDPVVVMEVVQQNPSGEWQKLDHTPQKDESIAFAVSTNQPIHIALLAAIEQQPPRLLFDYSRVPPGTTRLIKLGDTIYSHRVGANEAHERFCIMVAKDQQLLAKRLEREDPQPNLANFTNAHCAGW